MTKKTRSGEFSASNSVTKTIRFNKMEYDALETIAKSKGMDFSVMIRKLVETQLTNSAEHDELLESFKSVKPEEVQKNFLDIINNSNDVLLKAVTNNNETVRKKLEFHEKLIRGLMYLVIYFNREMPDSEKEERSVNAKKRLRAFIQSLDKEG